MSGPRRISDNIEIAMAGLGRRAASGDQTEACTADIAKVTFSSADD